jgi:hypothetical protein
MRFEGRRITVDLPNGWEGQLDEGLQTLSDGAVRPTVAHLANFPLPPGRGDFAGGAVQVMQPGDALIVLFEYGPDSVGTALFESQGVPRTVRSADFDREVLHVPAPGMSGLQRFFTANGRAFCLYVVVGSHIDRADVVGQINEVLASLEVGS